jgi:hypothetical protein
MLNAYLLGVVVGQSDTTFPLACINSSLGTFTCVKSNEAVAKTILNLGA